MPWNAVALPWKQVAMPWNNKPTADDVPTAYGLGQKWQDPRLPWKQ
jgi:hypothetical protein